MSRAVRRSGKHFAGGVVVNPSAVSLLSPLDVEVAHVRHPQRVPPVASAVVVGAVTVPPTVIVPCANGTGNRP